jgi:hypothetical protein
MERDLMKKIIAILTVLSLCSCGSQPIESTQPQTTPITETAATTTTITTTVAETSTSEETTEATTETTVQAQDSFKALQEQAYDNYTAQCEYINQHDYEEPLIVYEDDNISVSTDWWVATDYVFSERFTIENKTDKEILIRSESSFINEYDIDLNIYETIAAGKKKVLFAENNPKDMKNCIHGKDINCIGFKLVGVDFDSFDTVFETDTITINIEQ